MSALWVWLRGRRTLETRFAREVARRSSDQAAPVCTYRGVTYPCSLRAGSWGVVEG